MKVSEDIVKCKSCGWVGSENELMICTNQVTLLVPYGVIQTSEKEEQCPKCLSVFIENYE